MKQSFFLWGIKMNAKLNELVTSPVIGTKSLAYLVATADVDSVKGFFDGTFISLTSLAKSVRGVINKGALTVRKGDEWVNVEYVADDLWMVTGAANWEQLVEPILDGEGKILYKKLCNQLFSEWNKFKACKDARVRDYARVCRGLLTSLHRQFAAKQAMPVIEFREIVNLHVEAKIKRFMAAYSA